MASRSEETLREAAAEIEGETETFAADTGDLDRLAALPGEVSVRLGAVEILVTNTGGPPLGATLERSIEEWEAAYRSLVVAPRVLIEAVLPGMRERKWGRIVNVGSSSTREPIPHLALSNIHRMAAVGLASNWGSWEEMERDAVQGVPAGRLGTPEEYGDLVAFLASERAGFLTGTVIPLDGGMLRST
jgi:3-oxoacyl-[acyl-carrier protein] reductase